MGSFYHKGEDPEDGRLPQRLGVASQLRGRAGGRGDTRARPSALAVPRSLI